MDSIYQWAATLSQSGANYPTALPLKVDKLANGFQVTMCGNNIRYGDMGRGFTVWHRRQSTSCQWFLGDHG